MTSLAPEIELPIVVCGELIEVGQREPHLVTTDSGVRLRMPKLTDADVDRILASRLRTGLAELHFDDITIFFRDFSRLWLRDDHAERRRAVAECARVSGYPERIIERDYRLLMSLYHDRAIMYDQLETELGNRWYLDEWVPSQTCLIRAQPRGLVTSVLVGNIPLASVFAMLRSLIVKNNSVCKVPRRDPVSALHVAASMARFAPDHPITKSLSVAYWERDSEHEARILAASDAVCVWGGERAVTDIKRKISAGTRVLEYGPKRSLSIVDLRELAPDDTLEQVALRAAHDCSVYDQEACFAVQETYVTGSDAEFDAFVTALRASLDHYLRVLPKGQISIDTKAHVHLTRSEEAFLQARVESTTDHGWTLIIDDVARRADSHPLARTLFVHRVASPREVIPLVDRDTQTVTMYPWRLSQTLRDPLTLHGVDRIAGLGMANFPRTGFPHDGIMTYHQLVRWVSVERDIDFKGKYYDQSKARFHEEIFVQGLGGLELHPGEREGS